ncbi:iron chelate uptake ABC transporter family permease subunit, partial [Bacillus pseudomycoides]
GFIGIITPHFARFLVGVDHRWRVPYSGLLGAILLILADIAARYVIMPQEVPVGVMTAFIGAPFFIYIA